MAASPVVLLVSMKVKPESEERFRKWFASPDHPGLRFSGMRQATRYKVLTGADDNSPDYMTIYEFDDETSFHEYMASPERERQMKFIEESWPEGRPYEVKWRLSFKDMNR